MKVIKFIQCHVIFELKYLVVEMTLSLYLSILINFYLPGRCKVLAKYLIKARQGKPLSNKPTYIRPKKVDK